MSLAIDIADLGRGARAKHELYLLPIGSGVLTPDAALEWLESDHHLYCPLVMRGLRSGEEHDRGAAEMLLLDLAGMAEACGRALAKGKPVHLERTSPGMDFEAATRDLCSVLRLVETEYGDRVREDLHAERVLLEALARELAERAAILLDRKPPMRLEAPPTPLDPKRKPKRAAGRKRSPR